MPVTLSGVVKAGVVKAVGLGVSPRLTLPEMLLYISSFATDQPPCFKKSQQHFAVTG